MKKTIVWIVLVFFLYGCLGVPGLCVVVGPPPIPHGTWQSVEPNLVFFVDPGFTLHDRGYPGIYVREGENVDIVVVFYLGPQNFAIYEGKDIIGNYLLFSGWYNIENSRLYLIPFSRDPNTNEFDTIVFELVE